MTAWRSSANRPGGSRSPRLLSTCLGVLVLAAVPCASWGQEVRPPAKAPGLPDEPGAKAPALPDEPAEREEQPGRARTVEERLADLEDELARQRQALIQAKEQAARPSRHSGSPGPRPPGGISRSSRAWPSPAVECGSRGP